MSAAPSPNGGSRRKKKTELACQPKLADANTARLRQGFGGQPSLCFASEGWCRGRDSNPRPPHYECGALPAELPRHISGSVLVIPEKCKGKASAAKLSGRQSPKITPRKRFKMKPAPRRAA